MSKKINEFHHYSSPYLTKKYDVDGAQYLAFSASNKAKSIKNDFLLLKDFDESSLINNGKDIEKLYLDNDSRKYSGVLGLIVDYLGRFAKSFQQTKSPSTILDVFNISLQGFEKFLVKMRDEKNINIKADNYATDLLDSIYDSFEANGEFTKEDIQNANQLVRFDSTLRAGYISPDWYDDNNHILNTSKLPDYLVDNILIILNRYLTFLNSLNGVVFHPNLAHSELHKYIDYRKKSDKNNLDSYFQYIRGFTLFVDFSDADFEDETTMYDLKCSIKEPTTEDITQLLIYYTLAKHSDINKNKDLKYIAIVNPVLNKIWRYEVSKLDKKVYQDFEKNFMGYDFNPEIDKMWFDKDFRPNNGAKYSALDGIKIGLSMSPVWEHIEVVSRIDDKTFK